MAMPYFLTLIQICVARQIGVDDLNNSVSFVFLDMKLPLEVMAQVGHGDRDMVHQKHGAESPKILRLRGGVLSDEFDKKAVRTHIDKVA